MPDEGPALVLGSVRGRRSFGVLPDGRLTGLYYTQAWAAGENQASCFHEGGVLVELPGGSVAVRGAHSRSIGTTHGLQGCTCGFYAYYRADPYARSGRISGIIEGFGRVVLGTQGFRAEKARILALVAGRDLRRTCERYPDVAWFAEERAMLAEFPPTQDGPSL
ncbi:MAG: hypothetical protein ACYC1Z_01600 [Georgenia sp.]